MLTVFNIIMVFIGGSLGGFIRFALSEGLKAKTTLPGWCAILFANLLGSFIIGIAFGMLVSTKHTQTQFSFAELSLDLSYALLITGFCGGLTTYSTFSLDNLFLYYEKKWGQLAFNLLTSIALCSVAVWAGVVLFGDKFA